MAAAATAAAAAETNAWAVKRLGSGPGPLLPLLLPLSLPPRLLPQPRSAMPAPRSRGGTPRCGGQSFCRGPCKSPAWPAPRDAWSIEAPLKRPHLLVPLRPHLLAPPRRSVLRVAAQVAAQVAVRVAPRMAARVAAAAGTASPAAWSTDAKCSAMEPRKVVAGCDASTPHSVAPVWPWVRAEARRLGRAWAADLVAAPTAAPRRGREAPACRSRPQ